MSRHETNDDIRRNFDLPSEGQRWRIHMQVNNLKREYDKGDRNKEERKFTFGLRVKISTVRSVFRRASRSDRDIDCVDPPLVFAVS
jgi:hypothetical protein